MFPSRSALVVALGAEVVAGHVSSLRGASPSRSDTLGDNATTALSFVVGYEQHAHLNCYTGHGGEALGPNDGLQAGVNNVDACGRAAGQSGVCFVYFWEQNKCFLRSQCNLDQCEVGIPSTESYAFDTFTPGPVGAECLLPHGQGTWGPYSPPGTLACFPSQCEPGYTIVDMACEPTNYIKSEHENCYTGHGGTALGPNDGLQDAHDVEGCKSACNNADGCSCFVYFSKYNRCFLRSECNMQQCERGVPGEESYDFDTYIAS